MPNSPTIVSAALSDKELQASINQMVANFDKGLQTMLEHSNEYVGKIQESLQKIGNTNFGAKGSNDGGVVKQTKAQDDFTDAVKRSTNEIKRQGKETAMSFDQIAAAQQKAVQSQGDNTLKKSFNKQELQQYIDRLRELQAEYIKVNTQEGGGAKSDKIKADMRNLEELIAKYREILRNLDYVNSRQGTIDVKKWVQDLGAVDDRYKKLTRWYTVLEKEDQRRIASEEKANQKRLADLEKEKAAQDKVIKSYQDSVLKAEFGKVMKMPTSNIDEIRAKFERLSSIIANIRELGILSPEKISAADSEVKKLGASIQRYEKFEQERIAAEQKFVIEQAKEVEQTQTLEGRVKGLAQAAREYMKANSDSKWSSSAYGKDLTIYAEGDVRARGLSIEEQIRRQLEAEQQVIQQQVSTSQQLNNERKKYVSPTINDDIYQITRNAIARKLGIDTSKVINADAQYDSIKRVGDALKQLQDAYTRMTNEERNSPIGKQMIRQMQELQRQSQQLRAQMSRPISLKDALSGSEKTLDDIAYKMRQLASYRSGLNVETQVKEIEQVNKKYAQLQKNMNDIMQKNTDMIASNTALGRSWNYMKNRLAFYFTVGAGTSFVKQLIDIRSQYELLERSIGILFDSMQTGSKIFSELNQMAIKSPFTTMELGSAAKQLSAYNIAAKDVVDTTRRLADMAAAVGIPIERLTYALGQIKSYGYLNSRDARMFANAGIPLIQNLADMYTKLEGRLVSIGDVYDRIKKKQVSFEDTLKVVHEMTDEGGRFFNFQEKAADTLKVRLANLTLAWNNMLNNMGKSNQGVLTSGLGVLKEMFENWRKIENIILAIATNFGTVKAIQLLILLNAKGITKQMALQEVLGKRLGATIYGIARNLRMLAVNPMTWLTIVITAVTYLSWKFWDLTNANENFNKSIADGTKENIASIDKFFDKYRKDIESVGSMNTTDQEKMWERVRDEIEKATKNAQQYIDILEKIPELDKRVSKASGFLEQEKVIQEELNRLAQHGYFNIGGGFADDSYAEALTTIDKYTGEMIRKYGTYEDYIKAFKNEFQGFYDEFRDAKFSWNINEEIDESVKHFKKLESLNWGRILSGGTDEEKLARIRDTFMSLRDNFFATEEMQNAGAEAQALYNRHMDYWITSVARANGLIKELTVNGKTYSAEDIAAVEERRTEWEAFFSYLSDEERRTMDYLVKTNQTGGEEFKKLWDTMADSMRKSNATAYRDLQKKIAELRETPDIVINVVYREMRDKLDEQQKAFEDRWIRPKDWSVRNLSAEDYLEEETANRTKYGRLMRKTEEDNVEWEERLGKEYQENAKKIKSLNAQLNNKKNLSEADREQKEKDLNLYKDLNKAIVDIGKAENFNYDQFKKGGKGSKKDPLLDSLKLEASLVEKLQGEYDKLTKSGASQAEALETIRGAYGKTIRLLNAQLGKYGLPQLDISQLITGKDPHKALEHFQQTLNTLVKKGMLNVERSKELEMVMQKLTLSAKTYDLDKITKGLNNELGKLKDEYELAVELDANPELGGMFLDMFGIDPSDFSHSIDDYMFKVQSAFEKARRELGYGITIDVFKANDEEWKKWGEWVGLSGEALDDFKARFVGAQGVAKKWATDVVKQTQDLQYKLADNNGKIAIEEEKLAALRQELAQETNDKQKALLELQIQDQQNAINKLKEEILQLLPTYNRLFGEVAEHSASMTRKLARDYKNMLVDAQKRGKNPDGTYTVIDPVSGKSASVTEERLGKEIKNANKELGKTDNVFKKIKESLTKGEDGIVDWVGGIENIGEAIGQVGDLVDTIGNVYDMFGNPNEYDATSEALHDIATTMQGVNTAAKGIGQIASGDYIGGAMSVISGLSSAISTWFDNGDKEILQQIKESERAVKRLELAYIDLEHAIKNAYGMATIGAQQAAIANKELQLAELKHQLQLEQSRDSKDKDEDRIIELKKQIKELEYDIKDATDAIVNDLLGISSVGDALDNLMGNIIESFRQGSYKFKEIMKDWKTSINDMIANMVKKMFVTKILQPWFDEQWNKIQNQITERAGKLPEELAKVQSSVSNAKMADVNNNDSLVGALRDLGFSDEEIHRLNWFNEFGEYDFGVGRNERLRAVYEKALKEAEQKEAEIQKELATATMPTTDDIRQYAELLRSGQPIVEENLKGIEGFLRELGLLNDKKTTTLSALQQGIQGITEDTAGALEAYVNGVSQQVYLQSDLLTQIRDAVVGIDIDVQVATQAQMLLQLQQSYAVQMAIQGILEGWNNPSGQAVRVELVS